jgi:hypothetical protein
VDKKMQKVLWGKDENKKRNNFITRVQCKCENILDESDPYVKIKLDSLIMTKDQRVKYQITKTDNLIDFVEEEDEQIVFEAEGKVWIKCSMMNSYIGDKRFFRLILKLEKEDWKFFESEDGDTYYWRYRRIYD